MIGMSRTLCYTDCLKRSYRLHVDTVFLAYFILGPDVVAVLCGDDTNFTYPSLSKTVQYLTRNLGCQFLVTNEDNTHSIARGVLPGAWASSSPLRYTPKKDLLRIGKPSTIMLDCIGMKYSVSSLPNLGCAERVIESAVIPSASLWSVTGNTDMLLDQNSVASTSRLDRRINIIKDAPKRLQNTEILRNMLFYLTCFCV